MPGLFRLTFTLAFALVLVLPQYVFSGVYKYTDKDGVVHITNRPLNDNYRIVLTDRKRPKGFVEPAGTGREYKKQVDDQSEAYGIPHALLLAIIKTESNFNPKAVSPKGAKGLMQLMPSTARYLGVSDPLDPVQNVRGGARYFKEQYERFKDVDLALAAYNAGPANVEKYNGIPPFEETKRYVQKVNWFYDHYKKKGNLVQLPGMAGTFDSGNKALLSGHFSEAAEKYKRVVHAFPDSPEANYNLGLVYDRKGNAVRAIYYYRKAVNLNPYFKEAYYNLAILYEKIGRNMKAITTWKKFMKYEVKREERLVANRYIRELRLISKQ